ncbi:hypothetical protein SCLCIDRAFT_32201 [Scleroderma citrinum Foug A]|uniref:Uncharacterized protein n=1 Tax=Scleroderma citrinum Foug A TaxID=1036808 RepID=A0A0C3DA38_9AGAM|nr:hypothetical protein SCLCIDRAFT_32201 [Scleroderma citrinum Foug A]
MSGRPCQLDHEDLEYLVQLILFSEIQRAGVSCKKLKCITAERDEGHRAAFIAHMAQYDATKIGFIDEVLRDE